MWLCRVVRPETVDMWCSSLDHNGNVQHIEDLDRALTWEYKKDVPLRHDYEDTWGWMKMKPVWMAPRHEARITLIKMGIAGGEDK